MTHALRMLLLLGALIGLFGQSFAYASPPAAVQQGKIAAAAMDGGCVEAMQRQQPEPAKHPCKGLTFDCIAQMGCLPPLFLDRSGPALDVAKRNPIPPFWIDARILSGAEVPPEPHPPSILV